MGTTRAADREQRAAALPMLGPLDSKQRDTTMTEVMDEPKTRTAPATPPATPPVRVPLRRVGPPPAGELPALLLEHATKRFIVGRRKKAVIAVNDVTMAIRRGEISGILGANGSGKSTRTRLVSTLLRLDGGRVEVLGHVVERDELAVKQLINRVSVDAAFFKKLSPHENLADAARLYGLDVRRARAGASTVLARLGI